MKKHIPHFAVTTLAGLLLAANLCGGQPMAVATENGDHWVGTWGASPQLTEIKNLPPAPGLTSNTLRQIVQVSIGGNKLRVKFSNAFGRDPVTMHSVHLALSAGRSAIETNNDHGADVSRQTVGNHSSGRIRRLPILWILSWRLCLTWP